MTRARREDSLREAEQESQREDISTKEDITEPEQGCPNKNPTSRDPFGETPGPITEPWNEELGDQLEMDLDWRRKRQQRFRSRVRRCSRG